MTELNIAISIVCSAAVLMVWGVVAYAHRPRDPAHDIRRRALKVVGTIAGTPLVAATVAPPNFAMAMLFVSACVVLLSLWMILRRA